MILVLFSLKVSSSFDTFSCFSKVWLLLLTSFCSLLKKVVLSIQAIPFNALKIFFKLVLLLSINQQLLFLLHLAEEIVFIAVIIFAAIVIITLVRKLKKRKIEWHNVNSILLGNYRQRLQPQ